MPGAVSSQGCLLCVQKQGSVSDQPSSSSEGQDIWKALWKLKVQPKKRVFWWWVLKGFLPSLGESHRPHVSDVAVCLMCGHDNESLFHASIKCEHALLFWREAADFFDLKLSQLHPLTWLRDLLDPSFISKDRAVIAFSEIWAIWSSRNKYTHGEI